MPEWMNEAWNWLWLPARPATNWQELWVLIMLTWLVFKHLLTKHGDK